MSIKEALEGRVRVRAGPQGLASRLSPALTCGPDI